MLENVEQRSEYWRAQLDVGLGIVGVLETDRNIGRVDRKLKVDRRKEEEGGVVQIELVERK